MNAEKIGTIAINALTRALAATIKPGLVDRNSNGARKDVDFFTELAAINAMSPWLIEIARLSIDSAKMSPTILFSDIRKLGLKAEADMNAATGGLNTYKGSLFSLALCVAAAGRSVASKITPESNSVCILASEMAQDLCQRELDSLDVKINLIGETSLSAGERVYMKYKFTGARGEAQGGFQTVRKQAMPVIRKYKDDKTVSMNDMYVQTYMTLMAHTDDTGICAKESDLAVEEVRDRAKGILERGGIFTPLGREKIEKLDVHMRGRGLYPGASGALLTVAIFLSMLEEGSKGKKRRV
ncbi:MAG: triphosphoribosyl-dephospho-CoA synthase [Defluviitaleaceae bacterium]|nr:triphosphoribosyl-dephospho-CoA synthase [Defluviitaleaceae bacterium]MCL2836608.1 triphosphoribosyl-dephospho-CoA synthase [Defluviitaleaceae bacterium]